MHEFSWEEFLLEASKRIPSQQFSAWVEAIQFIRVTNTSLVLSSPTPFLKDWILDHYREIFTSILLEKYGLSLEIQVEVNTEKTLKQNLFDSSEPNMNLFLNNNFSQNAPVEEKPLRPQDQINPSENSALSFPDEIKEEKKDNFVFDFIKNTDSSSIDATHSNQTMASPPVAAFSVKEMAIPVIKTVGQPLEPKLCFDSFVVGASNQFAHAAARAVAEQPGNQYNPLFIYSDAGLGKTHLLHAIGNFILAANPKVKICYISAEKFVNDLIESIHHGKMQQFREKHRNGFDILLMDDIQFIAGKDRTQEEFFHTFNTLHSSRKQIVVTSDKFPKDIPGLEDRIRTRFEWGLIADIQPPEIETRIAILRAKANRDDIFLPPDVALFLASNIKTNIRELEGSLIRLGAEASFKGSEISLDLAKQVLGNIIKEPTVAISTDLILSTVASHFDVRVADLKSLDRSKKFTTPRQIAMYMIRKYCLKSYMEIGLVLGGRDHTTTLHGSKVISTGLEKDPEIRRHVEEIQNSF